VRDVRVHAGATLWEILAAGEWRSPKFLAYLDIQGWARWSRSQCLLALIGFAQA
jgi:hypothetical protein